MDELEISELAENHILFLIKMALPKTNELYLTYHSITIPKHECNPIQLLLPTSYTPRY